ncbi:MAG: hypothetical protein ACP5QD_00620 [Candidatus Ratteibacteria bacterium]
MSTKAKAWFSIVFTILLSTNCNGFVHNLSELSVRKPFCLSRDSKEKIPPSISVYADRLIYLDTDKDGQGLVVINPPNLLYDGILKGYIVQVYGEHSGKSDEPSEIEIKNSDHIGFDIDVSKCPEGESVIKARLLDNKRKLICESSTKIIKKTAGQKAIDSDIIPLLIANSGAFGDAKNIPITTGIPLPDGILDNPENVQLFENGKEIPVQTCVRSRWSKKGSIKWLGLDFLANYSQGCAADYTVKLGKKSNALPTTSVKVNENEETIEVENGVLLIKISKKRFRLFDQVFVDKNRDNKFEETELFLQASPEDGPYWIAENGKIFRMASDNNVRVYIEEKGPLKTGIRADGWAISDDGEKAGKFVVRMVIYSGQSEVQVNCTFIVTWDTLDSGMKIRDLGIKSSYRNIGANLSTIPHEWWKNGFEIPQDGSIFFLADRWNSFYIKDSRNEKVLQSVFGTFGYTEGLYDKNYFNWFGIMGENLGIGIVQRHLFQLFPKEIEATRNSIVWHAWPYHSTEMIKSGLDIGDFVNLRWLHQGKLLDFQIPDEYFEAMKKFKEISPDHKWRWGGERRKGYGTGVAITGELLYVFDRDSKQKSQFSQNMNNRARIFEQYAHAIADPEWIRKTEILEPVVGGTSPDYKQIEEGISNMFDRVTNIISDNKEYGQFIWPDGHIYYTPGGSPPSLHRAKLGYHHGSNLAVLYLYLRSGEWKYWNFYESFSRHLLDHVSVNYDPWNPETDPSPVFQWPGAVYHCDGYVPWGSYHELWGHMGAQYSYLIYYYLTGDSRALDMAKEWAESVLKKFRIASDYNFSGMIDRNPAGGWMVATNYYADLHDARLLRLIWEFRNKLFAQPMKYMSDAPPPAQSGRYWMWTYTRYWRDPLPLKLLSEWVDEFTRAGPSMPGYSWPVKATDRDGKPLKAVWCHEGSSREVDLTMAGPMYGNYSPYFIDASLFTANTAYIKYYWFINAGLAQLRQWAHGHPSSFFSLQWLSDDILRMAPLIPIMKELELPEVPCMYPFSADSRERVFTVIKEDTDREFTLSFWGYVPEKMKDPLKFLLMGPDGNIIREGEIPTGPILPDKPYVVKIKKDNKTGEYMLKFTGNGWDRIMLNCPFSDLPEVYVVPSDTQVITATQYFWKPISNHKRHYFTLSGNTLFRLETPEGDKIKTEYDQKKFPVPVEYEAYRISFCQKGVSSSGPGKFISSGGYDLILAADASLWFYPDILKKIKRAQ